MRYTHLFFDLDNTLWDFNSNSYDALRHALGELGLLGKIADYDQFYTIYHRVNDHLWDLYREGAIAKPRLTVQRFEESFEKYGYPVPGRGAEINEAYLSGMPAQTRLVEGARELLDYLAGRYRMAIITNGFREVQYDKMEQSGLSGYFDKVFVSEEIGAQKPNKLIFEHALKSMNAPKRSTLMIGDSWEADIVGARLSGLDQVFYDPMRKYTMLTADNKQDDRYKTIDFSQLPPDFSMSTLLSAAKRRPVTLLIEALSQTTVFL